jgi:hypothetical protein
VIKTTAVILAAGAFALAGCADKEQTAGGFKSDAAPFQGTNKQPPYMAGGWKQGDRTSWEQALKTRTVQGQNDYAKVP